MDSSNERVILAGELMPLVSEQLAAGQKVRWLPFRGISMLPMLRQGRDSVELSPLPERLKKYDLPVYQRPDGQYVMHRVVGVRDGHYICLGDNTVEFEKILPEQMIGVVSAFKRDDRRIGVDAFSYRLYCRLWRCTRPVRRLWRKAKALLRKLIKRK